MPNTPDSDNAELCDVELLARYAHKRGFGEQYTNLMEMHKRGPTDPLELLVQAQQIHRDAAKDAPGPEESIDGIVEKTAPSFTRRAYEAAIRIPKTIMKGTWYAIRNMKLYYPFVGALPYKFQKKIAHKLDDKPEDYVAANILSETLVVSGAVGYGASIVQDNAWNGVVGGVVVGVIAVGVIAVLSYGVFGGLMVRIDLLERKAGSPFVCLPYHLIKGMAKGSTFFGETVKNAYAAAWSETKALPENTAPALPEHAPKVRIEVLAEYDAMPIDAHKEVDAFERSGR